MRNSIDEDRIDLGEHSEKGQEIASYRLGNKDPRAFDIELEYDSDTYQTTTLRHPT